MRASDNVYADRTQILSDFRQIVADSAERLRRLEVRGVVYFHCDHFEPWDFSRQPPERAAEQVIDFVDAVQRVDFARRLTLFYSNPWSTRLSEQDDLRRAAADDRLGFVPRSEADHETLGAPFRYLRAHSGHEIQIHIHHENFTRTRGMRDPQRAAYLNSERGRGGDGLRLECAVEQWLELARREFDYVPERWFFVHGLWALNGSDPEGCTIHDEIARLMKWGCRGDFTFPAGRPHCDPRFEAPYFCAPAIGPKSYDSEAASPEFAWGNSGAAAEKFFIWNSPIKAAGASLDWGDPGLRRRLERPEPFAREIIEASFRWDGVLFIKTHAHSMHHMNRDDDGLLVHPHCYGPTRDLYGAIFEAAGAAGATVTLATAGEVYDRFVEAQSPADRPPMSAFRPSLAGKTLRHVEPTSERVLETAAELDGIAVATLTARIAELGVDGSGAESHYASLAARGSLLPKHDLRAAQILLSQFAARHAVHEIGSGVGMLPLLLAALGVPALGIERSQRRYDASRAIAAAVARYRQAALAPHDFLLGRFPECIDGVDLSNKVSVITDFTCTMTAEERQELMWALRGYGAVLLDLDRFVRRIGSPEERQELIAEFRRLGFAAIYDAEISADFAFVLMVNNEQLLEPASAPTPPAAGPPALPAKQRPEGIPASGDAALDGIFALPLSRHRRTQDPQNAACTRSLRTLRRRILIVARAGPAANISPRYWPAMESNFEEYFNPRSAVSRGRSIAEGQSPAEFIITLCQRLPNRIFCTKEGVHSLMPLFEVGELPEHIADWHFIYLTRRNIVRQAISLLLAEETGQWRHDIEPMSALRPDALSFAAVARRIEQIFVARDLAQRFFTVFDIAPLEICYEDLIVSPGECLARFVEFVGLTPLAAGNAPSDAQSDRPRAQSTELNRRLETAFRAELHRRVSGRGSSNDLLLEEESMLSDSGTTGSASASLAGISGESLVPEAQATPACAKRIALPGPFEQEIGLCWISRLDTLPEAAVLEGMADHDGAHMRSTACLCEDTSALGPAHSAHAEIRRVGGGAFSHWRDRLYFSTSDNSDPNLNGRAYHLQLAAVRPSARPHRLWSNATPSGRTVPTASTTTVTANWWAGCGRKSDAFSSNSCSVGSETR